MRRPPEGKMCFTHTSDWNIALSHTPRMFLRNRFSYRNFESCLVPAKNGNKLQSAQTPVPNRLQRRRVYHANRHWTQRETISAPSFGVNGALSYARHNPTRGQ